MPLIPSFRYEMVTPAQKRVLRHIALFIETRGYSPTIRDIADLSGYSSPGPVFLHVRSLELKGMITRSPSVARTIALTTEGRSFLNEPAA